MDNITIERRQKALENIKKFRDNKVNGYKIPLRKRIHDAIWIKGLQLNYVYIDDWNEITDIFERYGVMLRKHGSIITINELKTVRAVDEIVKEIGDDPKFQALASVGLVSDGDEFEKEVKGRLFITLLRILPEYCRQRAFHEFKQNLLNGNFDDFLYKVFSVSGTIKDTEKKIDDLVTEMINNGMP